MHVIWTSGFSLSTWLSKTIVRVIGTQKWDRSKKTWLNQAFSEFVD
jgi:hypothetical protein